MLLVWLLPLTDGPTAVVFVAFVRSRASVVSRWPLDAGWARAASAKAAGHHDYTDRRRRRRSHRSCVAAVSSACAFFGRRAPSSHARWSRWNTFSRVRVIGNPEGGGAAIAWALEPLSSRSQGPQLRMDMILCRYGLARSSGDSGRRGPPEVRRHKHRTLSAVMPAMIVVGTGGGRDVLSALAFGGPVIGVEINRRILESVNRRFGDFTGHLDAIRASIRQ